jgi:hypothetical protein
VLTAPVSCLVSAANGAEAFPLFVFFQDRLDDLWSLMVFSSFVQDQGWVVREDVTIFTV